MASETTLKVKLVKCPKCWKILPLYGELRVYKCGGCGALLQAKSQQNSTDTIKGLHEASTSQNNELDDKTEFLPSQIHPLKKNDGSGTRELGNCSGRQLGGVALSHSEDEESDLSNNKDIEQVALVNKSSEEKMNGLDNQDNSIDIDNLQLGVTNLSSKDIEDENEDSELEDCSPRYHGHLDLSSLEKKNMNDYDELRECIAQMLEQQKYSNDVQHGVVHSHNEGDGNVINNNIPQEFTAEQSGNFMDEQPNLIIEDRNNQKDQRDYADYHQDWHEILEGFIPQSRPANCENQENSSVTGDDFRERTSGGTSPLVRIKSAASLIEENGFSNRKMSTESQETTVGMRIKIHAPADVFISSDNLSSPTEQLEHSQRSTFDCGLDSYEASEYGDHSLEYRGILGNVSYSPAIRRSQIYDDSAYHYDSTDSQQYYIHSQPMQVASEVPDFVHSNRSAGSDRQPLKALKYRSAELQHLALSSTSMYKNPDTMRNSRSGQIYKEPTRHQHPIMNWDRSGSEHYPYEVPLHQENPISGRGSEGLSNLYQQDFGKYSSYLSPDRLEGIKQERKELLMTVSELEDQLNKTRYAKEVSRGGSPAEVVGRDMPLYYNEANDEELFHDLNYATSPGRFKGVSNMGKGQRFSRIPYSGEVTNSKHYIHQASTYRPRDSRFSAPLPTGIPRQNVGLSRSHLGYSPHSSHPSSPQLYLDSKYSPKDSDLLSIDLTNEDCSTTRRMKEGSNPDKQHFLPTAGGAPFVTCYNCLNLLQLPADLLLFQRKYLRLKCGSCSTLLKFAFLNRMHVVPYSGNINPLLHEVDGNSDVNNENNVASTSNSSPRVDMDPMPYSIHASASKQRLTYSAPLEPKGRQGNYIDPVGTYRVSSPSTNSHSMRISSETQKIFPTVGSPLHRLMGYASPTDVISGYETSAGRTSSRYRATQD